MAWPDTYTAVTSGSTVTSADHNIIRQILAGRPWFNVKAYGAVGDGSTDDRDAVQDAMDACGAAGGGTVFFPEGTYRIATAQTGGGFSWGLIFSYDNVEIVGVGAASRIFLDQGGTVSMFVIGGHAKAARVAGDVTTWGNYRGFVGSSPADAYDLTGTIALGDMSVFLDTAAEAANFAVGDYVVIRTGNLTGSSATGQPDAEINTVRSVNAGTGEIGLASPTIKAYQAENYNSGSTGITSVGGAGTAAPFQLMNLNDRMLSGIRIANLYLETRSNRHLIIGGSVDGLTIEKCTMLLRGGSSFMSFGAPSRGQRVRQCRIIHQSLSGWSVCIGTDTGSSDAWFTDLEITADAGLPYLHIEEGSTGVHARGISIRSPEIAGDFNTIAVRNRAYDITLDDIKLVGGATTSVIFVDTVSNGGGVLSNISIANSGAQNAITFGGSGWHYRDIRTTLPISHFEANNGNYTAPLVVESISTWVADTIQTATMHPLPAFIYVLRVHVYVLEAFNSSGTDQVSVGYSADHAAYAAAVDVSTTGIKTTTLGWLAGYTDTSFTPEVYYTNGGSEPTTGKALVVMEFCRVSRAVT